MSWATVTVDEGRLKRVYLNKLLLLLTPSQTEMCNKMYPGKIKPGSVDTAIAQIERTLTRQNIDTEKLTNEHNTLKEEIKQYKTDLSNTESKNKKIERELKKELELANSIIRRLENPINVENAKIQERLEYLDRLEAAGVDNWNGLDNWEE